MKPTCLANNGLRLFALCSDINCDPDIIGGPVEGAACADFGNIVGTLGLKAVVKFLFGRKFISSCCLNI